MPTPLFPGKFEPFHKGHLLVIQGMVKTMGSPIIVICESSKKGEDMFTVDERREMISAALLDVDIMDATIVSVKDAEGDGDWAEFVLDVAGKSSGDVVVWSGREEVRALFEARDILTKKIVHVPGIDREHILASLRAKDGAWKKHVPAAVAQSIEAILRT